MRVSVGSLTDLPDGQGVRVESSGHRVAVFRLGDAVYAIGDRCSHAEASLAEGEVFDTDVECPRHGSEFSLLTGEPDSFPATRPVPTYEIEVVDGEVFLELEPIEENA
ncbi:MAG: non-heme iron oxygenase ferredoxin subunit [Acidimicrobiia bacterium]|nr:non-heme iron oxygenase ferredoxin subunit [Acidimicrobiia bacterium]MBT8192269.1 non-heme iron oxygenase ferredoxin subunit [Acidimicrobiia bacterium]NNF88820.1 non-heme iron oxygenase ferredoxin subunit [Acidimicrobiia bacterium]NNL13926.1 non-heme iron oxygenase ferredoxin subunit [Acidimicrobiia bacterium]NNL99072.1 non-heme iron oxygenase ferredoxin subunit [Acidimicrobiia bacterium]